MTPDQLTALFDRQAPTYDQQWSKLSAFPASLHALMGALFATLPRQARVLSVGAGTGAEIHYLATRFPGLTFTAVEPSTGMLDGCRRRAQAGGYADRCTFHAGYLDTLAPGEAFDGATCLLVSQFILDRSVRTAFFRAIADRLRPGGLLVSSDLSADTQAPTYRGLLDVWLRTLATADLGPDDLDRLSEAYRRDVGILPGADIEAMLVAAGLASPMPFFQAGLIRAWYSRRESGH